MSALRDGWPTSATKASPDVLPETPNNNLDLHTRRHLQKSHTEEELCLALTGLPRPDLLVTTMITPMGTGGIWLGDVHVCFCVHCVCSVSCVLVSLLPCMAVLVCRIARVYLCPFACVCARVCIVGTKSNAARSLGSIRRAGVPPEFDHLCVIGCH